MGEESVQVTVDRMRSPDDAVKCEDEQRDGEHEEGRGVRIDVAVLDGVGCNNHDHLPVSADAPYAYCSKLVSVANRKHPCNSTFQHRNDLTLDRNQVCQVWLRVRWKCTRQFMSIIGDVRTGEAYAKRLCA